MKNRMKYLMLSCRQACLLMVKKKEGKLRMMDRIRLKMHTTMCSICRKFEAQSDIILTASSNMEQTATLSDEARDGMRRRIREHE